MKLDRIVKFIPPLLVVISALVDNQRVLQVPVLLVVGYWLCRCYMQVLRKLNIRIERIPA